MQGEGGLHTSSLGSYPALLGFSATAKVSLGERCMFTSPTRDEQLIKISLKLQCGRVQGLQPFDKGKTCNKTLSIVVPRRCPLLQILFSTLDTDASKNHMILTIILCSFFFSVRIHIMVQKISILTKTMNHIAFGVLVKIISMPYHSP